MTLKNKFRLIDLFCGCGGLTAGFVRTKRFAPVFANDFNTAAMESFRANFDKHGEHSIDGDIIKLLDSAYPFPEADIVAGGPPCQGFSLLNKNREGDVRRSLWFQFMRVVELSRAHAIVMENVPQLIDSAEFHDMKSVMREFGFKYIQSRVLTAADYGVPEVRRRAIIVASKMTPISLPRPTHMDPKKLMNYRPDTWLFENQFPKQWRTVKDAIADLPKPKGTEIRDEPPPLNLHFGRTPTKVSIERYKAVPPGGNRVNLLNNRPDITPPCWIRKREGGTDLFGRLWWDRPSITIRTEFYKPEKGRYLHPEQHRPITHREAARIQSFPDEFVFKGTKIEIARQIGNAVPPLMAYAIAEEIAKCLDGKVDENYVRETEEIYRYSNGI